MISFIASAVGFLMCPIVGAIVGIVFGKKAQTELGLPGADQSQLGLAKASVIIAWVVLVLQIIGIIAYIIFFVMLAGAVNDINTNY